MATMAQVLARGVLPAADLQRELAVSPATLMRMVRAEGDVVVRVGRARATRYGWRQPWQGLAHTEFSLVRVSEAGTPVQEGHLITLAGGDSALMPQGDTQHGLPLELVDNRPAGFLGRHFALRVTELQLPDRLDGWSDHHILLALSRRGEDLTGNLIVGDESFARWQAMPPTRHTRADYPQLAEASMAGNPPGSSAGGARPKFGAFVDDRHVLVKFAAQGQDTDLVARRWCDLLVFEWHALQVIAGHGIPASSAELLMFPTHVCLEVERFDRVGLRGRRGLMSLAAVHDNLGDSWSTAAARLLAARRVSADDARRLRWLDAFGVCIGNTDRHPFNVAFLRDDSGNWRLAPAFDPVSMFYAPAADGRVRTPDLPTPIATAAMLDVWDDARLAAREFWRRAADDDRVSDDLRAAAGRNAVMFG
ncbi:MAG: HipA domain-containing protein [Vicinamibacterales bacterium]